jgi:cytochrome c-type biogenesis protein CcmH
VRQLLTALAALALATLVFGVVAASLRPSTPTTAADQARQLAAELRCPDCQALSVAESRTVAAEAIRAEIAEQLAAGRSADEIRASFVARYGQWILLQPADPLVWVLPALAVLAGVGAFWWWLRARTARATAAPPPAPADGERQRVRDELEALDG